MGFDQNLDIKVCLMLKYGPKVSKQSKRSKILGSFAWCLSANVCQVRAAYHNR